MLYGAKVKTYPTPPPPFQILNFKMLSDISYVQKQAVLGLQDVSGASFFDGICDVLCTYTFFSLKIFYFQNTKKRQKVPEPAGGAVLALPPPSPKPAPP